MNVTATPAPRSTILLEVEVPTETFDRAIRDATGRLSRRTRVAGFRPGKAPRPILERVLGPTAVVDEAVEQVVQSSYREAILDQGIVPLTNADVEVVEAEEGKPLRFKATVQTRLRSWSERPRVEARTAEAAPGAEPQHLLERSSKAEAIMPRPSCLSDR